MPIEFCFDDLTIGDHFNLMLAATMGEDNAATVMSLILPIIAKCTDTDIMALPMHLCDGIITSFLEQLGQYMQERHA